MKTLLAACLFLFSITAFADQLQGKVVRVADGDTITILDSQNTQHKIRLMGIDAPEKGQPFGDASKRSLSDLVFGKLVTGFQQAGSLRTCRWESDPKWERFECGAGQARHGLAL